MTFLGQVCKTSKGFQLKRGMDVQAISSADAKDLIDGGIVSLEDLAPVGKISKPKTGSKTKKKKKRKPTSGG